jgi:hypothetical protein
MNSEDDLIKKLMVSKQIMDKHNTMGRNGMSNPNINESINVATYDTPPATYNLPQDLMEDVTPSTYTPPTTQQPLTKDRVMASKLPDAIKQLMIEHPIAQPTSMGGGTTLSNDLIEKAARLMNTNAKGDQINPTANRRPVQEQVTSAPSTNELKKMIRETIEEVLGENGLLTESTTKSNEVFSFKVGKHIFEGKVTKIKKIA